ncbi:HdeD family acid-resistance protein [Cellulomonas pakistanensis]|uniref:HdeD family acid-resistance protein n=1 Tax=Cellulomonas pakistanensis TaxID=992287 RepID=A0A919P5E1_9CELL|nr:DUF308 domain-containing protein [Cellulomonas pakistanensis]GIG34664.1 hypothetical protein Cpa01nite_00450 [Cellulomonas pakistanensis]
MAQDVQGRVAAALRSVWWLPVLRGVLMIVLGLLLLVEPLGTLVALVWVFGVFAVVDGAVVLLQALLARGRPGFGWLVAEGLVSIGFGALIMLWPDVTALTLFYLLALWVLVLGVTAVIVAVTQYRARDLAWSATLVFGLVGFLFGLLLAIKPQGTVEVILTVYGLFAFVAGVVMLVGGFATRSLSRQLAADGRAGGPRPAGSGPAASGPAASTGV